MFDFLKKIFKKKDKKDYLEAEIVQETNKNDIPVAVKQEEPEINKENIIQTIENINLKNISAEKTDETPATTKTKIIKVKESATPAKPAEIHAENKDTLTNKQQNITSAKQNNSSTPKTDKENKKPNNKVEKSTETKTKSTQKSTVEKSKEKKSEEKIIIEGDDTVPHGKFVIKKTENDNYVYKLYSYNHRVIAVGGEPYASLDSCKNGILSVIANAESATLEDQTLKKYEEQKCPKWQIYKDKSEEVRLRLIASNGNIIATTNDGYNTKDSAKRGIEAIVRASKGAEVVRNDNLW